MSDNERWCYEAHEHGEHETRLNAVTGAQMHCGGVSRDEAVVLDMLGRGGQRYVARQIIAELDKARAGERHCESCECYP